MRNQLINQQILKSIQGTIRINSTFSILKSESDKSGFSHDKFQLYHQGVKVEYATYSPF
jgi:hypothetical protein